MENTDSSSFVAETQSSSAVGEGEVGPSKFPASDLFCEQMRSMVCCQDVSTIRRNQQHALHRFEKTNEMFERFNELSAVRFEAMQGNFRQHTKLLVELKKDLESVFRRIRNLKVKLNQQYPEAFEATHKGIKTLEDELEEDQNTVPQELPSKEFSSLGDIFVNKSLEIEETGAEVSEGSTSSSTKLEGGSVPPVVEVQGHESRPYKDTEDSDKDVVGGQKGLAAEEERTQVLNVDADTDSNSEIDNVQIENNMNKSDANEFVQKQEISTTDGNSAEELQDNELQNDSKESAEEQDVSGIAAGNSAEELQDDGSKKSSSESAQEREISTTSGNSVEESGNNESQDDSKESAQERDVSGIAAGNSAKEFQEDKSQIDSNESVQEQDISSTSTAGFPTEELQDDESQNDPNRPTQEQDISTATGNSAEELHVEELQHSSHLQTEENFDSLVKPVEENVGKFSEDANHKDDAPSSDSADEEIIIHLSVGNEGTSTSSSQ